MKEKHFGLCKRRVSGSGAWFQGVGVASRSAISLARYDASRFSYTADRCASTFSACGFGFGEWGQEVGVQVEGYGVYCVLFEVSRFRFSGFGCTCV